ncbi:MAG: nickel pincer cofactor biosynthesis protein LarB [Candidatus Hecatellales archaeon]|nr:MAG: nickel pincer cofactor biosynthesis protein LarB [Candidatus Hecatellales archaeon]
MTVEVRRILRELRDGRISLEEAERRLKLLPILQVEDYVRMDLGRERRRSIPEIVYAQGKQTSQLLKLAREVAEAEGRVIIARAREDQLAALVRLKPKFEVEAWRGAGLAVVRRKGFRTVKTGGKVAVLTAGTADIPVAVEAEVVAGEMGCEVYHAYDVGVAGFHRLLEPLKKISGWADVVVVVAGMEGALPSVVASLLDIPVIGVPSSVGYGYGGGGRAALMSMLQTCSLGLAVVNVDNGVGAGAIAALIANRVAMARGEKA